MKKSIKFVVLMILLLSFTISSVSAFEIKPFAELPDTYPGSNVIIKEGDVLYSTKSLDSSTLLVGHVGIVGSDMKVYHVNPVDEGAGTGGKADALYTYFNRHGKGEETIKVYRATHGRKAAAWAKDNYSKATKYSIPVFGWEDFKLGTISTNYCSKFIWQAFYYGNNNTDYIIGHFTPSKEAYITPSQIIKSKELTFAGSFKTPKK